MTMPTKPLEVDDFTGGITDYFVGGRPNQAEKMDNLFLTPDKNLLTRWGSEVYQAEQMPLGSVRVNKIFFYDETLFAMTNRGAYFVSGGVWTALLGPGGGTAMVDGDANSILTDTEWQGHTLISSDVYASIQKIYRDSGTIKVQNAGLPDLSSTPTIVGPDVGTAKTYLYAFVYRYDYTVDTVDHLDRGPVTVTTHQTLTDIASGNAATITLPTTLPANENWDTANMVIEVYRTTTGGSVYYLCADVGNPTGTATFAAGTFTDDVDDATIATNETLYTTGGDAENDTPPLAKYVHVVNDIGYYGNIKDGTEEKTTLLRQSIPGDVDSVPGSFFHDFEQSINGVSSIFDRPVILCEDYIYRVDGNISPSGTGDILPRRIDDKAGCVSTNGIVQTHLGLFWAGKIGFYWTDGLKVLKISNNINETYKKIVLNAIRKKRIYGTYDPSNERVYWSVCMDDATDEVDTCIILDLKWGLSPEMCFTTMSSGEYFKPTSLHMENNVLYRGDTRGYILQHSIDILSDPKIDTGAAPGDWEILTIIHHYKSCFLDFSSKFYRKWVPRILISASNTTNLSLAIASSNDNNRVTGDLKPIRYRDNSVWGASLPLWGDPEAKWNYQGLIEEWRRFPAGGLRCNYKQVQLTNAELQIVNSDLIGKVTIDQAAKTATLGGTFQWITDIVDYKLFFDADNYQQEYVVTARTPTTLTFSDPGSNAPPDGLYNFILKGKPKEEVLELNGYVIHWASISKSHTPFSASSLGSTPSG